MNSSNVTEVEEVWETEFTTRARILPQKNAHIYYNVYYRKHYICLYLPSFKRVNSPFSIGFTGLSWITIGQLMSFRVEWVEMISFGICSHLHKKCSVDNYYSWISAARRQNKDELEKASFFFIEEGCTKNAYTLIKGPLDG